MTYKFLLEGVSEFDVQGGAISSEVNGARPLAFPIAVTPAEKAFIAGAYYGQGQVILYHMKATWVGTLFPLS